jgi:hypothetical protein
MPQIIDVSLRRQKMFIIAHIQIGMPLCYCRFKENPHNRLRKEAESALLEGRKSGDFMIDILWMPAHAKEKGARVIWKAYPLWWSDHPQWWEGPSCHNPDPLKF